MLYQCNCSILDMCKADFNCSIFWNWFFMHSFRSRVLLSWLLVLGSLLNWTFFFPYSAGISPISFDIKPEAECERVLLNSQALSSAPPPPAEWGAYPNGLLKSSGTGPHLWLSVVKRKFSFCSLRILSCIELPAGVDSFLTVLCSLCVSWMGHSLFPHQTTVLP